MKNELVWGETDGKEASQDTSVTVSRQQVNRLTGMVSICTPTQILMSNCNSQCWRRDLLGGDWIMGVSFPLAILVIESEFSGYLVV